ncbi:uncharacterized protein LOC107627784 [Arachis ipaensis]|nr:uncharacterized protein LOC107627784 [Arachis ipaensis]
MIVQVMMMSLEKKCETKRRESGLKHAPAEGLAKSKRKFLNDDDALVVDDEECEVDLSFLEVPVTGDENLDNALDPGAESDGANSWHLEEMKTPLPSEDEFSEEEPNDVFPVFRDGIRFGDLKFEVGMKFNTKSEFKEAVREFTIQEGRHIQFIKNDAVRCRAVCKVEECKWVVYASRDHEETCWQIKTFNDDHTCAREATNRTANRNWLTSKLVKKVRKYPHFRQCEAAVYFKSKCDLVLNKNSISRALADARVVVYRDEKAQYAMVRDYRKTLLKCNPGSTVRIGTIPQPDGEVIFQRMYVCLSGCKNGFKAGCRRLIGLDGAFLKTQTGGQILSIVGQDANHHIYVIAWAIVDIENTENWRWFLELLHEDLGDYKENKWCFMSNMQKGLLSAVQEWKDLELKGLLWECARSTTYQDFSDNMKKIKKINEEAWNYLNKWLMDSWTKSAFSHAPKLDNICNNTCEVFNARIKEARAKPIITLLEEVRMFVMRTITKNKVKLAKHVGKLPPMVQSRLDKIRKEPKS